MSKAYKIEVIAHIGYIDDVAYFFKATDALKEMKRLIAEKKANYKKNDTLAKSEDIPNGGRNGEVKTLDEKDRRDFKENVLYEGTVYSWHKVSYEYDEWDVDGETYRVVEIEVK